MPCKSGQSYGSQGPSQGAEEKERNPVPSFCGWPEVLCAAFLNSFCKGIKMFGAEDQAM